MEHIRFIVQVSCDFLKTLPDSVRPSFSADAQRHINALEAIVKERDDLIRKEADKSQESRG